MEFEEILKKYKQESAMSDVVDYDDVLLAMKEYLNQKTTDKENFLKEAEVESIQEYVADFSNDQQHQAFIKGANWAYDKLKKD